VSFRCRLCGEDYSFREPRYRCECGGFLDVPAGTFSAEATPEFSVGSIWRFKEAYGLPTDAAPVTLGEGGTPIIQKTIDGFSVLFKLDFLNPSGSFKDRGASSLLTYMKWLGVRRAVEDSSGNAGAAVSAYAAAAGITCTIYVPSYTPDGKVVQSKMYGSEVVKVPGTRHDANSAAVAASRSSFYASHLWHPFFVSGLSSAAFEIWEDCSAGMPGSVLLPIGSGGLLEGLYRGFSALKETGHISCAPKLIGVQASRCAPIHDAFRRHLDDYADVEAERSVAEGISVARPPRARAVLQALRGSGGYTVAVDEDRIIAAAKTLARIGLYVEHTSAAAFAAWFTIDRRDREDALVILTGSGLKETGTYGSYF
jgi:threonine synthase